MCKSVIALHLTYLVVARIVAIKTRQQTDVSETVLRRIARKKRKGKERNESITRKYRMNNVGDRKAG